MIHLFLKQLKTNINLNGYQLNLMVLLNFENLIAHSNHTSDCLEFKLKCFSSKLELILNSNLIILNNLQRFFHRSRTS